MSNNRLKGKLVEKEMTYQDVADILGISRVAFHNKINGKTAIGFTTFEASKIAEALNLSADETMSIFFSQKQDCR